jgi:hypothetical protein
MERVVRADPRERLAQRVVDVDVRRAVSHLAAVQAGREHVEAGVDPAAAGEGLEAQSVAVARHHRVQRGAQLRLEVARGRDVGHREQSGGSHLRARQEAREEPRMVLGARGRRTP